MEFTQVQPSAWMVLPFVLLLTAVALAPFFFSGWWGKHYGKVALGLGAITVVYYVASLGAGARVLSAGHDYVSFIALVGSLFVVSGGIHITVKGEATPTINVIYLLVGAVLANLLGTTGASMLLIRPWIRMNKYRITGHHVVFFIFVVSNGGGCLTPVGDPPLFLGYLYGVPFWWVMEHCLPMWSVGVGLLLGMFWVVDTRNFRRASKAVRDRETKEETWRFSGLGNVFFLVIILAAVFINHPLFLREALMVGAAIGSYFTTAEQDHRANDFNFNPIKEVAILFAGIFATMMPALDWLANNAGSLLGEHPAAGVFYWGSGALSSVLDNAPTYLSFLSAMFGSFISHDMVSQVQTLIQNGGAGLDVLTGPHAEQVRNAFAALQQYHGAHPLASAVSVDEVKVAFLIGNTSWNKYILAVSIGSVFFGANTYIGNGPNFMVKAIADHNKVHTPTFIGYIIKYTIPYMLPMLLILWWLFFRG